MLFCLAGLVQAFIHQTCGLSIFMIISALMQSLVLVTSLSLSMLGISAQNNSSVPPSAEAGCVSAGSLNGMEFVYIPSGKFMMGSPPSKGGYTDEHPHQFLPADDPKVTQGMREEVMGCNPCDILIMTEEWETTILFTLFPGTTVRSL